MKDTIIKGTKNSRSIVGAASIPATWEQARAQLIQSGWPIDLGPLNAAGLTQKGDDLNKANLLKDATAAAYGLTAAAVPDDIFNTIYTKLQAINSALVNCRLQNGAYTGEGIDGVKTINFSINPGLFVCSPAQKSTIGSSAFYFMCVSVRGGVDVYFKYDMPNYNAPQIIVPGTMTENSIAIQKYMNQSGIRYYWFLLGT